MEDLIHKALSSSKKASENSRLSWFSSSRFYEARCSGSGDQGFRRRSRSGPYRQRVRRGTAIQIIEKYDPVETTARVYHVDPPTPDGMVTKEAEKKTAKKPKIGTETTFITKDGSTIQVSQNIVDKHNLACEQLPLLVSREKFLLGNGAVDSSISSVREEIKFHLGNLCPREQELAPHIFKKLPY